ncbi:cytoplasmic protein [Enterobacterales bacterium CwR94]|nr:cytoplasmic protein [Enterobacterales bacterium CwR94]
MVTDDAVLKIFRDELSIPVTWRLKKIPLELDTCLQDYAENDELPDALEEYSKRFNIDTSVIDMANYFPEGKKKSSSDRKPLTVRMFAESAKAGRWLYD